MKKLNLTIIVLFLFNFIHAQQAVYTEIFSLKEDHHITGRLVIADNSVNEGGLTNVNIPSLLCNFYTEYYDTIFTAIPVTGNDLLTPVNITNLDSTATINIKIEYTQSSGIKSYIIKLHPLGSTGLLAIRNCRRISTYIRCSSSPTLDEARYQFTLYKF